MKNSNMLFDDFCQFCGSCNLRKIVHPSSYIHYARLECCECGQFIKWIRRPPQHQKLVDTALSSGRVSGWESLFLKNIRTRKHLSPAQSRKFEQIISRHKIKSPVSTVDTG